MSESKLTKSAKALLEYFRTFPAGEPITATRKELATALNAGTASISRAVSQLEELGEIRIESGKEDCKANTYFLNVTPPATFVSKDFTPKANAVLKNYIPLRQEEENRPEPRTVGRKPELVTIPYSKAVVTLAQMSSEGKKPDKITNTLTINKKDVQLFLTGFDKLSGTLGISTHKLLVAGLASFADTNHVGLTEKRIEMLNSLEYTVSIPEKEYALLCGYDVEERPTNTTTELSKEKKRIKIELDNFRKQAKKDLNILSHARISWTELIKKKPRNFENVAIIGTNGIKNGYIKMTFDSEFIKYILQIPVLMQYSTAILSIDNRKATAYVIGLKMSEHYHMLQNHKKGTANRLKVKTLLECTDLQTIEEIRKSRSSWIDRIKEPFENALDELFQKGVISDWNYCKAKGMLLTDIEAQNIPDFETWSELNLSYELKNPADLTRLIEQKETAIEGFKADKKKKAGRPKKETDNPPTTTPKRKRGRPKKTES